MGQNALNWKHITSEQRRGKGRDEETDECTLFQNAGPPGLHCISASPGEFRNTSVRFPRCLSMSAETSCLMTVQRLSPLSYVSSLETFTLELLSPVDCTGKDAGIPDRTLATAQGGHGLRSWWDLLAPIAGVRSHRHWNQNIKLLLIHSWTSLPHYLICWCTATELP